MSYLTATLTAVPLGDSSSITTTNRTVSVMNIATLAPAACTDWCEAGDGHIFEASPEDQYCTGASRVVPVSDDGGALAVYEMQGPGQSVLVTITHNEDAGARLTLDEVRALRDALDALLSSHGAEGLRAA